MRKLLSLFIVILFINSFIYSQEVEYIKGKGYEGYIFPKEYAIWGFPPEIGRYTPRLEDIHKAEKILIDNIDSEYIKLSQKAYKKPPINKKTVKRYTRQYVGYLTDNDEIIIWINLFKKEDTRDQSPFFDIISVQDGGSNFWSIRINITSEELFDMQVNGTS